MKKSGLLKLASVGIYTLLKASWPIEVNCPTTKNTFYQERSIKEYIQQGTINIKNNYNLLINEKSNPIYFSDSSNSNYFCNL